MDEEDEDWDDDASMVPVPPPSVQAPPAPMFSFGLTADDMLGQAITQAAQEQKLESQRDRARQLCLRDKPRTQQKSPPSARSRSSRSSSGEENPVPTSPAADAEQHAFALAMTAGSSLTMQGPVAKSEPSSQSEGELPSHSNEATAAAAHAKAEVTQVGKHLKQVDPAKEALVGLYHVAGLRDEPTKRRAGKVRPPCG